MNISVAWKEKEIDGIQPPLIKHGLDLSQIEKRR